MLVPYRKNQQKIALGLLSFHENLKEHQHLLKELQTYENEENYQLYCYYHDSSNNVQGVIGIENKDTVIVHDISLNPSFRGEKLGFQMLTELQELYPDQKLQGTIATESYLEKWQEDSAKGNQN